MTTRGRAGRVLLRREPRHWRGRATHAGMRRAEGHRLVPDHLDLNSMADHYRWLTVTDGGPLPMADGLRAVGYAAWTRWWWGMCASSLARKCITCLGTISLERRVTR